MPTGLDPAEQLLVCEGQTDAAAMLDLGFAAIGRPGCRSTVGTCVALARRLAVSRVVIVGDTDEQGRGGAGALAAALAIVSRDVRVIHPPGGVKDAREWKKRGATRQDVLAAIETAQPRRLAVRVRMIGGRS